MGANVVVHEVSAPPIGKYVVQFTATLMSDSRVEIRLDAFSTNPVEDRTDFLYINWEDFEDLHVRYNKYKIMYMKLAELLFDEAFHAADEIRKFLRS
jgi:hypothetical protein